MEKEREFSEDFMRDLTYLLEECNNNNTNKISLSFEVNGNVLDVDIKFHAHKK